MEVWKAYDNKYEVSDQGRVRHIKHQRILKYGYPKNGSPQVNVSGHSMNVCHLVAKLFLGERPNGHDVHHKDHNPSNNCVDNLIYMSVHAHRSDHHRKYPANHCIICGEKVNGQTRKTCSRECHLKRILTERICKTCGNPFFIRKRLLEKYAVDPRYTNSGGIYCSHACRNADKDTPFIRRARSTKAKRREYATETMRLSV